MSPILHLIALTLSPTGQSVIRKGMIDSLITLQNLLGHSNDQASFASKQDLERDRKIRDNVNSSAEKISEDAKEILVKIRDKQQQFSVLITSLSEQFTQNEAVSEDFQLIIKNIQENLNDLMQTTDDTIPKLTELSEKLSTLIYDLQISQRALTLKEKYISEIADKITDHTEMDQNTVGDAELFMTQNVEIEHLKAELAQAQNQITTLTCLVDKQTQIIRSTPQQPRIKLEKNSWSGPRIFDKNKTIENAAKISPKLMSSSTLQYTQT